jgi:hypothetical protein
VWNIADSIWNIASVVRQAFSAPWSGTPAQWLMVYTGLCFLIVIGIVLYAWRRDGGDVLRQRFGDMPRQIAFAQAQRGRRPASARLVNLVLWIVIGLVLAVYLNGHK